MPSDFVFGLRSPRYGPFLVLGLFDTNSAHSAIFGPFLRHIVALEGNKGLFVLGQSRHIWSVAAVSLHLAVLSGLWDRFGPKKAVLGHKMRSFGRAPPDFAPQPWGATGEFLAHKLDLARAPPRL